MEIEKRLTVKQVADKWATTPQTVYSLIYAGKLKAFQVGKLLRLRSEDVIEYEQQQWRDPNQHGRHTHSAKEAAITSFNGGRTAVRVGYLAGLRSLKKQSNS